MDGFGRVLKALKIRVRVIARRHDLFELLMIALCTFLCGGESCVDMEEFAEAKEDFLKEFMSLPGGRIGASRTVFIGCSTSS